jgi:hypothetical protein
MSTTAIVVIVVVVIVVAALVVGLMAVRRRRLQQRFGPEYDRLVSEHDSKRKAEAELTQRERRVHGLDIRPLTDSARARYTEQWAGLQEQFVDTPADAVAASQVLVAAVMMERGYPTDDRDQILADLSVEHAGTLDRYRSAEEISRAAADGTASTEDLRQAMIHYRVLFRELLGGPADPGAEATTAGSAQASATDEPVVAETSDPVADDAVMADNPEPVVDDAPGAETREPMVAETREPAVTDTSEHVADDTPVAESPREADVPAQRTPRS